MKESYGIDSRIKSAIHHYLEARAALLALGEKYPRRFGGNDNIIGRIGEFFALRFLENCGQKPRKVKGPSNKGFDFIDGTIKTQVKVLTMENRSGRSVRLVKPWNQFVLIELGDGYQPIRIGILSDAQHRKAIREDARRSARPLVSRSMLGPRGLIGQYGCVYSGADVEV